MAFEAVILALGVDPLGQSEVGDVGLALAIEEDVRGLQVAVEDASLVRVMDGAGDIGQQPRGRAGVGGEFGQAIGEATAVDQLHAEIAVVAVGAHLMDGDDIGVVERGDGLGLEPEPPAVVVAGQPAGQDHLERHGAIQTQLAGREHDPHAAAGDLAGALMVTEVADGVAGRGASISPTRRAAKSSGEIAGRNGSARRCR